MARKGEELLIELGIVGILGYVLFFVSTNVNPTLGSIYTLPVLLAISLALVDYLFGSKTIKLINPNVSWIEAFMWGLGGYIAVILSTHLATALAEIIPLRELLELLAASAPVFSQSPIINWVVFGILIAYIETYTFFVTALDLFSSMFKVQITKRNILNPKMLTIMFGLSLLFLFYHVTAKGIASEATLILVFFMAFISLVTIIYTLDARPALIIHIMANSIAATSFFKFTTILPMITIIPGIG